MVLLATVYLSGGERRATLWGYFLLNRYGVTPENRVARVGIIRIMIETLWIRRYISVWKRMKSLWTLTRVQGFFPPVAYLTVRKQVISFLSCPLAKSPGQSRGWMIWVLRLLCWICIFLFQSTPENEGSSKGWWKSPGHVDPSPGGDGPPRSPHEAQCPWLGWAGDGLDPKVTNRWLKGQI